MSYVPLRHTTSGVKSVNYFGLHTLRTRAHEVANPEPSKHAIGLMTATEKSVVFTYDRTIDPESKSVFIVRQFSDWEVQSRYSVSVVACGLTLWEQTKT